MEQVAVRRKLAENLKRVEQRIADACCRAGRDRESVTLVAITKYVSIDVVRTMVEMGVPHLGESRVQELAKRAGMVNEWLARRARNPSLDAKPRPHWHMVGHLQRNKVKTVLPWIDMIHSLDSLRLAEEIDARAGKLKRVVPVLLEVNASGEPAKHGIAVAAATHLAEQLRSLKNIDIRGLMAMGPLTDDETVTRHTFERVRELFDEFVAERICGPRFRELSLGMSGDFEYGIEYGATLVRIGSALFEGIDRVTQQAAADS